MIQDCNVSVRKRVSAVELGEFLKRKNQELVDQLENDEGYDFDDLRVMILVVPSNGNVCRESGIGVR